MTDTDRLFDALKLMQITTEPTDTAGKLAWYVTDGTYLGAFTESEGLAHLNAFIDKSGRV